MRTAGILEGEPDLAFDEVGGVGTAALRARVQEEFVSDFVADGLCGKLVGILVVHGRTASLLNPDVEGGLELLFKAQVGTTPFRCAEDCFFATDSNDYAHECRRVRL